MADQSVVAQSEAQSRITIQSDDGFNITGTWSAREGGNTDSEATRYKEGGELFRDRVKAHPPSTERMTFTREYHRERDIDLYRWARANASRVYLTVIEQSLDDAGNAFGQPLVERALLVGVNRPGYNSQSTDIARIGLVVEPQNELG